MSSHLNYIRAQEHIAELTRAAEQVRLAKEARYIKKGDRLAPLAAVLERLWRSRRETVRPAPGAAADVAPAPGTATDVF
jgi:hypothetical protein